MMRRRSTWGEAEWNGREDVVSGSAGRFGSFTRNSRDGGTDVDGVERARSNDGNDQELEREDEDFDGDEGEFVLSGSEEEDESESEDENEIIDIPRPGQVLRHRNSRASLLSLPTTTARGNSLKASRDYGSMRSLCMYLDCFFG